MIAFPNAKINLGLNVIDKRPDGFHDIETVFYPVGLCDVLEIIVSPDQQFSFTSSGLNIPGDPESNLCVKAWRELSTCYNLPPVRIHLHKVIPMGSGLGGGSSDGAFAIKLLDALFTLHLSNEMMMNHARKLGSDCAFFIQNQPVFAAGKGDDLTPLPLRLQDHKVMVVIPGIHVDTAMAYGMITPGIPHRRLKGLVSQPIETWKETLVNDFEHPVFGKFPRIGEIKSRLYELGAAYASLSGSGAAVYGIFKEGFNNQVEFKDCFVWIEK
jgi:4-diphosphocytidyl-2-C-methyl-D-erythritol kinase